MAIGSGTFQDISASVSDIFAAKADEYKAQGDRLEAGQYTEAAAFAAQNEQFTANSTAIQEAQANRSFMQTQGGIQAATATNGFAEAGSSMDILADSARQGALQQAVLQQQGLITQAGTKSRLTATTQCPNRPISPPAPRIRQPRAQISWPGLMLRRPFSHCSRCQVAAAASAVCHQKLCQAFNRWLACRQRLSPDVRLPELSLRQPPLRGSLRDRM
jgi:hypothetical protein